MTKTPDLSKLVGTKMVSVQRLPIGSLLRATLVRALTAEQGKPVRKLESSFGSEILVVREDGLHHFVQKGLVSRFCSSFLGWVKRLLFGGAL